MGKVNMTQQRRKTGGKPKKTQMKHVNNYYANQERRKKKAIEFEKNKVANQLIGKTMESIDEDKNDSIKGKAVLPKTIVTGMQKSFPSEVTSDTNTEIERLREKLKKMEEELEEVRKVKKIKRMRKKREYTQIDWQVRNITKQLIFRRVKFITCKEQLDKYMEKNSIGYFFLKCYKEQVENGSIIGNRGEFWNTVKQSVYEAINEKRNAVQTALKKKWIGMYEESKNDEKLNEVFKQDKICAFTNQDKNVFFLFLDYFGQALIGHKYFNDQMKSKYNFSKVCTVSDEAFGMFTLERCWESWLSEMKRATNPQEIKVKAKHTCEKSNKKFGGWDQKGLLRFSDIAKIIAISRGLPERIEMENEYREKYYKKFHSINDKEYDDHKMTNQESTYVAYNDLGSDDEICQEIVQSDRSLIGVGGKLVNEDQFCTNMEDEERYSQDIEYGQNQDFSLKDEEQLSIAKSYESYNYPNTEEPTNVLPV